MTSKEFAKLYARTVIEAMDIRERSFDRDAAHRATEEALRMKVRNGSEYGRMVEYSQFYTISMTGACILACINNEVDKDLAYPMYLSFEWSNDLLDWAQEILSREES